MVLHIHSDASYLSAPRSCSRAGGHFFLSNCPSNPTKPEESVTPPNGPIHLVCKFLCNVMASAAETEICALYTNAQKGEEFRTVLQELDHPQPPTPIMTDNTTANRIIAANKGIFRSTGDLAMKIKVITIQDIIQSLTTST
eukprot:13484435-Ditylum_brightwellii.AAC.1